jgi:hypothetical protein
MKILGYCLAIIIATPVLMVLAQTLNATPSKPAVWERECANGQLVYTSGSRAVNVLNSKGRPIDCKADWGMSK